MSKTLGFTAAPPVNGTEEMPTLMPPVEAYAATPWSWYCQRALSAGCQQAPCCVLHATGAGTVAAPAAPGIARSAATTAAAATRYIARARIVDLPLSFSAFREPRRLDDAPDRPGGAASEHAGPCASLQLGREDPPYRPR